jgi:hypothetical protein
LKVKNVSDWRFRLEPLGLAIIFALLVFILTYYCSACNPIHRTSIGRPLGIPLALYGVVFTIGLFWAYFKRPGIYSIGINVAFVVSVALVFAQVFVLHGYCIYCIICEIIFSILWIIQSECRISVITLGVICALLAINLGTNYAVAQLSKTETHYVGSSKAPVVDQSTFHGASVYSWEGNPIKIEQGGNNIILIASWCEHCSDRLRGMSNEDWDKTLVIDIAIKPGQNIDAEKAVWEKIPGLRTDHMFFDRDGALMVDSLPTVYPAKS